MSPRTGAGLARVTIASPRRRADVALPEDAVVAELLPGLLRVSGDDLADESQGHGGWALRRADGTMVDNGRSLSVQEIRDGDVLHLVPRQLEWPELDYDDVVDEIATKARKQSRSWSGVTTRAAGISVAALALLVGLGLLLTTGPSWTVPGAVALGVGAVLLVVAGVLSRALADSGAAAAIGVGAVFYAFVGGVLVLNGDRTLAAAGSAQYLVGSAVLLVTSGIAFGFVGDRTQYFVAGMVIGVLGVVGAALGQLPYIGVVDIAAILAAIVVVFTPVYPLLSIRLGKLPMPRLPTSTEDLLADPPSVPHERVRATVRRSDELMTGMMLGGAVVLVLADVALALSGMTSAVALVALVSVVSLLRARLYPSLRHRLPLVVSGVLGLATLLVGTLTLTPTLRLFVVVPALAVLALAVLGGARYYQDRPPSPYIGRIADIVDVLSAIAVVPLMFLVIGFYGYIRGLFG